jgi:hypothetical protein
MADDKHIYSTATLTSLLVLRAFKREQRDCSTPSTVLWTMLLPSEKVSSFVSIFYKYTKDIVASFLSSYTLKSMLSERLDILANPLLRPISGLNKKSALFTLLFLSFTNVLETEFKEIYYLASEVRETINVFKTSLHKVEAMEAFRKRREEIVAIFKERQREARGIEDWLENRRISHEGDLRAIREQRRMELVHLFLKKYAMLTKSSTTVRLEGLGYGPVLLLIRYVGRLSPPFNRAMHRMFTHHKLVSQAKELTPRGEFF